MIKEVVVKVYFFTTGVKVLYIDKRKARSVILLKFI